MRPDGRFELKVELVGPSNTGTAFRARTRYGINHLCYSRGRNWQLSHSATNFNAIGTRLRRDGALVRCLPAVVFRGSGRL